MNREFPDIPTFSPQPRTAAPSPTSRPGVSQPAPGSTAPGPANQPLSEHHLGLGSVAAVRWFLIIVGVGCLAAGGVLFGLYRLQGQVIWLQWALGLLFACLLPLFVGIILQFSVWRVRVTAEGLTWLDRKGEHHCTWDEVVAVYRTEMRIGDARSGDRVTRLRLELADGRALMVNHRLTRYKQLCETVQTITAERLLPRKRAELRGPGATFGSVKLFRDKVRVGQKELPRVGIGYYCLANGHASFYPYGTRDPHRDVLLVRLAEVPNYLVILTLLDEMGLQPTPIEQISRLFGAR